ncbi:MAG TPA: helix-turn-helix domain-containing protein [Ferruginibacter sp.]|nr:helix-turn-helix domain-containing protein [Ferruginibacter sp.]
MLLKDFIPASDVKEFVQLYRIVHLSFEKGQPVPVKAYPPRPEHCLAFYPYDTETVEYQNSGKVVNNIPVVLYGQFSEVTKRTIGANFLVLQVIFYPGALFRLTGIPAALLTNEYLDAEAVFSSQLRLINEQLYHASGYNNMIEIINEFVRGLIKKQQKPRLLIDDVCAFLLNSDVKISIDKLAKQSCLSTKQLERKFKERTGINPKLYSRIIRFDKAFRLKNSRPALDWLRIAMECDYHDYQHLAKDYKDFTSLAPVSFHEIENNAPERKFGLSEGF